MQLKSSAVYVLPPLFLLMANVRRLGASSGPIGPGRHFMSRRMLSVLAHRWNQDALPVGEDAMASSASFVEL